MQNPMDANTPDLLAEKAKYEEMWRHADYRAFSPGLYALENLDLVSFFRGVGVHTILDAGCGSGKFIRKILEQHGADFSIRGFDIAANCLDPWFAENKPDILTLGSLWNAEGLPRPNDAVVCIDVLEHIPTDQVPAVLANLRAAATQIVFLGIALFPDGFGPKVIGQPLHLTVQPADWWKKQIAEAGLLEVAATVQNNTAGTPMWLYLMARPTA